MFFLSPAADLRVCKVIGAGADAVDIALISLCRRGAQIIQHEIGRCEGILI